MAEQPLNSMWLAAWPTLISGKFFLQSKSKTHSKLRMAHLFREAKQLFMLASLAWHHAQAM
jgi:hypothetical protein